MVSFLLSQFFFYGNVNPIRTHFEQGGKAQEVPFSVILLEAKQTEEDE
jgi:hypothetical protein